MKRTVETYIACSQTPFTQVLHASPIDIFVICVPFAGAEQVYELSDCSVIRKE